MVTAMMRRAIPLVLLVLCGPAVAATAADPAAALIAQAREAQTKGEADLALRLAQSAIVADPARPGSYVALGDVYAAQGQPGYARSYYELALSIDPAEPAAIKAIAALDARAAIGAAAPGASQNAAKAAAISP